MNGTGFDIRRLARRIGNPGTDWATRTRPGIRILRLSNTLLRVRASDGAGRTILFAADPPMVVEQYDAIFAALAPLGRAACFEEPGFGFSFPLPGFDFTRNAYAAAVVELLEQLGPGPYVLAFPCWTAYHALDVAMRRPDLVEALVPMQAPSWQEELAWSRMVARAFGLATLGIPGLGNLLFGAPYLGQALCALVEPRFVDRTTRYVIYNARQRPELVAQFLAAGNEAFRRGACNCQASVLQEYFGGEDRVDRLAQPGVVLWGVKDRSHRNSNRAGLLAQLPRSEVRFIENTGHHLEHENPARICEEIARLVATLPRA